MLRRRPGSLARAALTAALAAGASALAAGAFRASVPQDPWTGSAVPFLERYCAFCHSGDRPKAGLDLASAREAEAVRRDPETWDLVRELVAAGEMPPSGQEKPGPEARGAFLEVLEGLLGGATPAARAVEIDPGTPVLRRLNHREYRNTLRDLLGVDFPAEERFPAEAVGHGFDNLGESLFLTPEMLEDYIDAAREVAARAILLEDPEHPPRRVHPGSDLPGARSLGSAAILTTVGELAWTENLPRDGIYRVRVRAWGHQAGPEPCRMELREGARVLKAWDVPHRQEQAGEFSWEGPLGGGERRLAVAFLNDYYRPESPPGERDRNLVVERVEVVGPVDPAPVTEFQQELQERFGPAGRKARRAALAWVAGRAWRRPPNSAEVARLDRLAPREAGTLETVRLALPAILTSPRFLFRLEVDPPEAEPGSIRDLDPWELATRLSYFLWSSLPDETLFGLAASGELLDPAVLDRQVVRMARHPASRALAEGFAAQWLQLRNLEGHNVAPEVLPDFDEELRQAMLQETLLFFDRNLREERSLWEFVDGDSTFLNERLARHYGIAGVEGPEFRRVSLRDTPRRGILGQASILTVTSDATRTSPVRRGRFVLENLLGAPPPPPPPGAGALDESPEAAAGASLRERLELHRRDPACAVCHRAMDGLGFALEPFDAVGRLRERDGSFPVDARAELPDGRRFEGPLGLSGILREDPAFLRCLTEKLLTYALGRGLGRKDRPTVEAVLARLDPERPTMLELLRGIVGSEAFRKRRVPNLAPSAGSLPGRKIRR